MKRYYPNETNSMKSQFTKVVLFALLLTVCNAAKMVNICKLYDCEMISSTPTNISTTLTSTATMPTIIKTNFVYYTNVTYVAKRTQSLSENYIRTQFNTYSVKIDYCIHDTCWMGIHFSDEVTAIIQSLSGYYKFENNTMSLNTELSYLVDNHGKDVTYQACLIICVLDPFNKDFNYCTNGINKMVAIKHLPN